MLTVLRVEKRFRFRVGGGLARLESSGKKGSHGWSPAAKRAWKPLIQTVNLEDESSACGMSMPGPAASSGLRCSMPGISGAFAKIFFTALPRPVAVGRDTANETSITFELRVQICVM